MITHTRMLPLALLALSAGLIVGATPPAIKLDWKTLRGLNYRTGEQTPELKKAHNQVAKVPGFMIPLDDDAEEVTEFLLVPYVGACVHTPPPPPNQIVQVKMENNRKTKLSFWDPVWVQGKFEVVTVKSPYGDVSFRMTANLIEPYKD
ncbi:MAG: DUF3299 domain-containing protein [Bryobacterales bacterium]|nr:DUF3299 domain-containing protein [Bryobacterales bacterium]